MAVDVQELFEQEIADAEAAPEPGVELIGQVIANAEGGPPPDAPARISKKEGAGYVMIYHTETGEPSIVNRNLLQFQLRKILENGKRAFSARKSDVPTPKRGKYTCLLHSSSREPWMDEFALPTCRKATLTSPYQVRLHMQHRHKTEWATIEERRQEMERQEQRDFQRSMLSMAAGSPVETTLERSFEIEKELRAESQSLREERDHAEGELVRRGINPEPSAKKRGRKLGGTWSPEARAAASARAKARIAAQGIKDDRAATTG